VLALGLVGAGHVGAQSLRPHVTNWEDYFRIDWQADQGNGHAVLSGYVVSVNKYGARWMQLLIDSLDARGQLVEQKLVWLSSEIPRGSRVYFESPVAPAVAYRVSVYAYEPPLRP